MNHYLKVGHRGAPAYEPENTLISFQKAIDFGVDMVELDVHLSKNNDVIVIHDQTTDRTTNKRGRINKMTRDEIKSCKIFKNQKIPSLQEVIDITQNKCAVNIEIKNKEAAKEVLKIWDANNLSTNSLISSNHVKALKYIKSQNKNIQTALVFYATKTYFRQVLFTIICWLFWPITKKIIIYQAKQAKVDWINIAKEFAFKKFIKKIQGEGFKVGVWIVNKKRHIKKFASYNVEAIISDYPDRLN